MNTKYSLILSLFVLFSCAGGGGESSDETRESGDGGIDSIQEISVERNAISESLDGYWMNDGYLTEIERTRSVYQSREHEIGWFVIYFDKQILVGNEPKLGGGTSHEGGAGCDLRFNEKSEQFESFEPQYFFNQPFTVSVIEPDMVLLEAKDKSGKLYYRKSVDNQTSIRDVLFKGEYHFQDDPEKTVRFAADGELSGFGSNGYYELVYDFGEGINYDVLFLMENKDSNPYKESTAFTYKFSGDLLTLKRVELNWNTMEHQMTDSTITLIKKPIHTK